MKNISKLIAEAFAVFLLASLSLSAAENESTEEKETKPVSISGSISAEAGSQKTDYKDKTANDTKNSAIKGEVNLLFDANIGKYLTGHAGLKWEEDEETDAINLDESYLQLGGNESFPLYLKTGKMYVPFGKFETNMISDPLTLEIGETRKTAVEAGFNFVGFYGSVYTFNGEVAKAGKDNDKIDNFGASMGYTLNSGVFDLDIGGGYVKNIFDSNGLMEVAESGNEESEALGFTATLKKDVPAMSAYAIFKILNFYLAGEYIAMLKDIKVSLENLPSSLGAFESLGLKPVETGKKFKTWNIEAGYSFSIIGRETTICIGYQGVTNAEEAFPEKRYIGAAGVKLMDNLTATVEYAYDEYETGDKANTYTGKIEVEF